MAEVKEILISDIQIDEEIYPRSLGTDWRTLTNYKMAMNAGTKFPPIAIAEVGGKLTLIDGLHRLMAHKQLRKKLIEAEHIGKLSETEAITEAIRRNIAHGRPLLFRDKLSAYKKLRAHGIKIDSIVGILHIPRKELRRYIATRVKVSATGVEIMPKPALMHLEYAESLEEQKSLGGDTQPHMIEQLIVLIEKDWLDIQNAKVLSALAYLKRLLRSVDTKDALPWGKEA